jgi:hypothetical protein
LPGWTKAEFMGILSKAATPNSPKNVFDEKVFQDPCVRRFLYAYRKKEISTQDVFARIGENPGLFLMAMAEGYSTKVVAKIAGIPTKKMYQAVLNACQRAKFMGLLPMETVDAGNNLIGEVESSGS